MKKLLKRFTAILVCLFLYQTITLASSHREAPLISNDPLADNTDLYAFRSPCDSSKIILIANYIPFEHPAGGPNWYTFGQNIRYEIHVDNNAATAGDEIIYRFTFSQTNGDPTTFFNIRLGKENLKTTYILERSINGGSSFTIILENGIVPPPNIGPRSIESGVGLGQSNYDALINNAIKTSATGEKVFAGPIDDPFFVDLGGAFDVGGFRRANMGGRDGLAKFNCHSLVLEIPIATLQKTGRTELQTSSILDADYVIGVWASASRPEMTTLSMDGSNPTTSGSWIQVSRLGMPLTNEVIIPIGEKDLWNATTPANDLQFAKYFSNPELGLYMDDARFGAAVPGLANLRIQTKSLGAFSFQNDSMGLFSLKGTPALNGTALAEAAFGGVLLPNATSPRAVDLLPIFYTGVPNLAPYQLATGKPRNNPLAAGKPFINNFLPTLGDKLRLNMAVPTTPRNSADFNSLGIVWAAVLGLTDARFNANANLQFIPNMDGFPNGRRLEDDVTTIELQAVSGVALAAIGLWYDDYDANTANPFMPVTAQLNKVLGFEAGVTKNDTSFKACFPFVQGPWRGFTGAGFVGPQSNDPLPVKLLGFFADKNGTAVNLRWQVTNEEKSDRYDVEFSGDGNAYRKIGVVKSRNVGNADYQLLHSTPNLNGSNFYRLKQVDLDGKISYSPVRLVRFGKNLLTVTPNPATNFIKIYSTQSPVSINVFDQGGRRVTSQILTNGMLQINISGFAKGGYTIVAEKNGERLETIRIIKQ